MYERILKMMQIKGIRYVAELERMAYLPSGSIKNIERGHMPSSDKLRKIARVLDVSVNYLLDGEPDDDPLAPTEPSIYEKRQQVLSLIDGLSDEKYQAAIDYLTYLKHMEELNK